MTVDLAALCHHVVDLVGERGDAQVTVSAARHGLTRFANSAIHQHVAEDTVAVTLKVAVDGRVASLETTRIDDDGLGALVENALTVASLRPVDPDWPGLTPPHAIPAVDHHDETTATADPAARVERVRGFVDAGPDMRAAGFVDTEATEALTANSLGHEARGRVTRATVDGIHQTATSAGAGHRTSQRLADLDGGEVGAVAAHLARIGQDPTDLPPGRYEVVVGPEAVATIAVFLGFYGFNAKQHLEGQSFVALGERQFDPAVTIRDDATDPDATGLPFDAEGTAKEPLVLVEDGVTRAVCHDRRTALRAGASSTGHAVPGGEAYGAFPTDLAVAAGDGGHLEDLVAGVERGVLVTQFHYCRILDPKTQVVTGLTRNGTFLVERGEIARPVSNLRFTQSFVEALAPGQVTAVGSPARAADTEFGPGLVVAPPVRLASWNFTGGAQG